MYNRSRRNALPEAVAAFTGLSELEADDLIEIHGMASYRATLESSGWKYIHTRRKWSKVK